MSRTRRSVSYTSTRSTWPKARLNSSALRAIPRQMHEGQYFKNKAAGIGRLVWQWLLRDGWRCNGKKLARGE